MRLVECREAHIAQRENESPEFNNRRIGQALEGRREVDFELIVPDRPTRPSARARFRLAGQSDRPTLSDQPLRRS